MKQIACADLPGNDGVCNEVVTGETNEECMLKMFLHAQENHEEALASLTSEQQEEMKQFIANYLNNQN